MEGSPTMSLILGVDPGLRGAFALYNPKSKKLESVFDAYATKHGNKNHLDAVALAITLDMWASSISFAVVEDVSAMTYTDSMGKVRGQGAAASFSFGRTSGVIDGVLSALNIDIKKVRPAIWKALLGLSADKKSALTLAKKLFPQNKDLFTRAKDDGRAEACLLAYFGADRLVYER